MISRSQTFAVAALFSLVAAQSSPLPIAPLTNSTTAVQSSTAAPVSGSSSVVGSASSAGPAPLTSDAVGNGTQPTGVEPTESAGETTITTVVTDYTTYCPSPTVFTEGSKTYTVTEATTLTITDCPCTRTSVISTGVPTTAPAKSNATWVAPASSAAPHGNTTETGSETTITTVVTDYTTYCPSPTVFTEGSKTYTVTGATTLTITDCPCTRTSVVSSAKPTSGTAKPDNSKAPASSGPATKAPGQSSPAPSKAPASTGPAPANVAGNAIVGVGAAFAAGAAFLL